MKILVAGDVHGAPDRYHHGYLARKAGALGCDAVFCLGDFGFWEHVASGVQFLDEVNTLAENTGVPWYAIDGNHDKTSLVLERYGALISQEGFLTVRPHLLYAPRGHRWTWEGVRFMSLGGAYSTDKEYRLWEEAKNHKSIEQQNRYRREAGHPERDSDTSGTLWFPEEEITDAQIEDILADQSPIDVLFTHDKPRGSHPGWNRKDLEECWPNQDRIQRVAVALKPKLLMHGHLHYKYNQMIRIGDDNTWCDVYGLDCDAIAGEKIGYKRDDSWAVLTVEDGEFKVSEFVQ
jgi:predicted phosphodiesterase